MIRQEMDKTLNQVIEEIDTLLAAASPDSSGPHALAVLEDSAIPRRYVLTGMGSLRLALPLDELAEVGPLSKITPLPNLPSWILGIVNVRSEIIPVIDLAEFLDLPVQNGEGAEQLVILRHRELRIALPIERIYGSVNRSQDEQKIPLSPEIKKEKREYFAPGGFLMEDREYFILNVQHLLTNSRFLNFNQAL